MTAHATNFQPVCHFSHCFKCIDGAQIEVFRESTSGFPFSVLTTIRQPLVRVMPHDMSAARDSCICCVTRIRFHDLHVIQLGEHGERRPVSVISDSLTAPMYSARRMGMWRTRVFLGQDIKYSLMVDLGFLRQIIFIRDTPRSPYTQ